MSNNKTPQRGLGKGLGSLLGGASIEGLRKPVEYINKQVVEKPEAKTSGADINLIAIELIEPNPFQPRVTFNEESLLELCDSIKSLGLIQPISVRRKQGPEPGFQIISGERRYRACRLAGLKEIPAYIIHPTDDQRMLEMAIVENIQREDLDPIEVAMSYQRLLTECNLTQEKMAERIGKKRASIANFLRLLKLPAKIQHDLKVGILSVGHAKVLLSVEDEFVQEQLCDEVIKNGWSVRDLEDKIKSMGAAPAVGKQPKKKTPLENLPESYCRVLEIIGKDFPDNISMKRYAGGSGALTIHFSNDHEVERFLSKLKNF